jgi:pilus assembly protein CpaF
MTTVDVHPGHLISSAPELSFAPPNESGTGADPAETVDYGVVRRIQGVVNQELDDYARTRDRLLTRDTQRQLAMQLIAAELERLTFTTAQAGAPLMSGRQEQATRDAVLAAMFGLGRLEPLLAEPGVEDIYIRGAGQVSLRFADGRTERRPPVAESAEDLLGLLRSIATHHGQNERAVTSTRPWLDARLPDGSRLAAVWGITPEPHVTIRRHRYVDIDLARLVELGTVSAAMAAFLQAAVLARRSILVVGPQSSGKTTLLRALAQCLPVEERFATIESEYELLLHELPDRFPNLLPYEARTGLGEAGPDGRAAGEVALADIFPTSLRHSLQRVIVGEVRGAEVIPLLMAMSRGYRGSMCTFHANSTRDTFQALASTMAAYSANWARDAAMQQIATALDLVVFVDREDTASGPARFVAEILEVGDVGENGLPQSTVLFGPRTDLADMDPRGYPRHTPADPLWARRVGFDSGWLIPDNGGWVHQFPRRVLA